MGANSLDEVQATCKGGIALVEKRNWFENIECCLPLSDLEHMGLSAAVAGDDLPKVGEKRTQYKDRSSFAVSCHLDHPVKNRKLEYDYDQVEK